MFFQRPDGSYASSLLEGLGWLRHGFGTRRLPAGLEVRPVALLRQVHSARVLAVEEAGGCVGEGDALITRTPGQYLGVRTADCLPVLLAAPDAGAVAAVHAGWRGAAAGILARTVERLGREWAAEPAKLVAAVGPGIGPCCYEVGPEVARLFPASAQRRTAGGRALLNLWEASRLELAQAGVPETQIDVARVCTCCRIDEFYSYRGNRSEAGRMRSVIGIVARGGGRASGGSGEIRRARDLTPAP